MLGCRRKGIHYVKVLFISFSLLFLVSLPCLSSVCLSWFHWSCPALLPVVRSLASGISTRLLPVQITIQRLLPSIDGALLCLIQGLYHLQAVLVIPVLSSSQLPSVTAIHTILGSPSLPTFTCWTVCYIIPVSP